MKTAVSPDDVRCYGPLTRKSSWEKALWSHAKRSHDEAIAKPDVDVVVEPAVVEPVAEETPVAAEPVAAEETPVAAAAAEPVAAEETPVAAATTSVPNFQIGDRVHDVRTTKLLNRYSPGTVTKLLNSGKVRVTWDCGGSAAQKPKYLQLLTAPANLSSIEYPSDLPEPETIDLKRLEIQKASPNLARAGGIYESSYGGYEFYVSVLHGSIMGGAIVAPNIGAWQFITGYLGELKNCYFSDWVVRRWFNKVARRIVDEHLIDDFTGEKTKPFAINFRFEIGDGKDVTGSEVTFNIATCPQDLKVFDFWVERLAVRALLVVRQQVDRQFFSPDARLLIACEGVSDRYARSRILSGITYQLEDNFALVAVALDDDYSVVASNLKGYGLGDTVHKIVAPCYATAFSHSPIPCTDS